MLAGMFQVDVARSGLDNMTIDQMMLDHTAIDSIPRLRIYQWNEPTVSLGYFQRFAEFQSFDAERGLPVVRRATGGGAIVHHFDWTYSIAMPSTVAGAFAHGASSRLYNTAHRGLLDWLERFQVNAQLWTAEDSATKHLPLSPQSPIEQLPGCQTSGCPFLCFERRHEGDVVYRGWKIMGSAQRRSGQAILQHGSLLLKTSPLAPHLAGLTELSGLGEKQLQAEYFGFAEELRRLISVEFSLQFNCCDWVSSFLPMSATIRAKFDSDRWIARI